MALLFVDSFDHYATADIAEKWTQVVVPEIYSSKIDPVIGAYGRNSTSALRVSQGAANAGMGPGVSLTLTPSDNVFIWGGAVKYSNFTQIAYATVRTREMSANFSQSNYLLACRYVNYKLWFARMNQDGTISIIREGDDPVNGSGTVLGTTTNALQAGVWSFVEIKVKAHNSTATVDVKINGTSGLSLTGQNTRGGSCPTDAWSNFRMGYITYVGGDSFTLDFDDVYVCDGSGSANNDFLGDVTIKALVPDGAGNSTAWTASTGSNYQCVDESTPNDDTDYVSTTTINNKDTYTMQDAPSGATIKGVQILTATRKSTEGPGKIKHVVRSGGADYDSAELGIGGTAYSYLRTVWETDPATGVAWLEAGWNACEVGAKKTG